MLGGTKCPIGCLKINFFYFRFPIGQQSISNEIGEMDIDLGDIPDITDIDINTIFQIETVDE